MKILITSDLHLTSRPQDEYRWGIFRWLRVQALNREVDMICILGDVTDKKDQHPARLVNRLVSGLVELHDETKAQICVLKGNHDYTDPKVPFFAFADHLDGIDFVTEPTSGTFGEGGVLLFLPHTKSYRGDWAEYDFSDYHLIFLHQTISGAIASNGFELTEGVPSSIFSEKKTRAVVVSGDIHVPQKVGRVTYCGSPHPVHFGDTFDPRVLLYTDGDLSSIDRATIRKPVLTYQGAPSLEDEELDAGDQIKVVVILKREELGEWRNYRQQIIDFCAEKRVILGGVRMEEEERASGELIAPKTREPDSEFLARYCAEHELPVD